MNDFLVEYLNFYPRILTATEIYELYTEMCGSVNSKVKEEEEEEVII